MNDETTKSWLLLQRDQHDEEKFHLYYKWLDKRRAVEYAGKLHQRPLTAHCASLHLEEAVMLFGKELRSRLLEVKPGEFREITLAVRLLNEEDSNSFLRNPDYLS
jgi:hypothetical protein